MVLTPEDEEEMITPEPIADEFEDIDKEENAPENGPSSDEEEQKEGYEEEKEGHR